MERSISLEWWKLRLISYEFALDNLATLWLLAWGWGVKMEEICYNGLMFSRLVAVGSAVAMVILLVMLLFTNPTDIGPLGVLLFFVLVYTVVFAVAVLLVKFFCRLGKRQRQLRRKDYSYAAVIAFAPIMLLLVQSLGSMNWFTGALVLIFVFLGCFLVNRRDNVVI